MRKTTNYNLSLYDKTDKLTITAEKDSLNHNMELIDEALKEIKDYVDEEIENSITTALGGSY